MKTIDEIMLAVDALTDAAVGDSLNSNGQAYQARAAVVAALREALTERKPTSIWDKYAPVQKEETP